MFFTVSCYNNNKIDFIFVFCLLLPMNISLFYLIKKAMEYLLYFIHQHQTKSGKIHPDKTHQILVTTQFFFLKTELRHKLFIDIFYEIRNHEEINSI